MGYISITVALIQEKIRLYYTIQKRFSDENDKFYFEYNPHLLMFRVNQDPHQKKKMNCLC